jgi:hypothetical protein
MPETEEWFREKEKEGEIVHCKLMSARMHKKHCKVRTKEVTHRLNSMYAHVERRLSSFCCYCED